MRITIIGGHGTAGRATLAAAKQQGHQVWPVSRREGVDVITGKGLDDACAKADVVVDAFNYFTMSTSKAEKYLETAGQNVVNAAARNRVRHLVLLSIIGVDRNPRNYYAGKLAQEKVYEASDIPHTIARTSQFHEFARQSFLQAKLGPLAMAVNGRVQPVAVSEVGQRLAHIAGQDPQGRAADFTGPHEESLADMVRRYAKATGYKGLVFPASIPTGQFKGMEQGLNLPEADAEVGTQTFDEWLNRRAR